MSLRPDIVTTKFDLMCVVRIIVTLVEVIRVLETYKNNFVIFKRQSLFIHTFTFSF